MIGNHDHDENHDDYNASMDAARVPEEEEDWWQWMQWNNCWSPDGLLVAWVPVMPGKGLASLVDQPLCQVNTRPVLLQWFSLLVAIIQIKIRMVEELQKDSLHLKI